ncbi:hypothetical protein QYE76_030607 [Lolium multiflorum]|uniref:Transposase (putative) gypsy type domain-containing protein n=1 Tax=Lolium multiflorum TaxID=4521 RepID=A0AAD8VHQ5_LOLMU|nr:hypothetical protein QYE76_030607 [Lolium multiflorum]
MGKKKSTSTSDAAKLAAIGAPPPFPTATSTSCAPSASSPHLRMTFVFQLWQLTPNSILHLSIFITVCEAFLGIEPHWGLWRKIFYVKRHNDSNGPPVVGGVGFVVRKEVDYFDYPMKESVQGWRNKWFYLRDPAVPGRRSNLPPFDDVLVAHKKKSWNNALSPEEKATADELFEQIVTLKNTGGLTMCGTEVVSVFLQRRVQPLMSRPHQLWLFTGKNDKSRVNSADLSADELQNEVRRLTCLSTKDTIVLTSARPPYDFKHLPSEAPAVAQCYPPSPKSGVVLEDDDDDSREPRMFNTFLRTATSKRRKLPKMTPFSRADVPIYATVDAVADFGEQFTRLEAENAQLRKSVKTSADQVLEANRFASDAKNENASLKRELSKLRQQMKDEQEARRAAAIAVDKKEGVLRESVKDLLGENPRGRQYNCQPSSSASSGLHIDALSLAAESNVQVLGLLQKTKGALSRLYSMIFPKMKQDKTLDEMADAFLVDPSEPVEIPSSSSRAELSPNSSSNDESGLVRRLRDQVSCLNKDITSLRAMAALVKKRGEIATAVEQYALDGLHVATESLGSSDAAEEDRKIHEEVEAMTDVAHPTHGLWLHRPKAVVMAKFKYRVMKAHYYFDKYYAHLTMVWNTLFPLDQAPETLSGLFTRFKSPERIRQLVRKELLAGAELAFASILACHPTLDLGAVANTERRFRPVL